MISVCFVIALICGVHSNSVSLVTRGTFGSNSGSAAALDPYSGSSSDQIVDVLLQQIKTAHPEISENQLAVIGGIDYALSGFIPSNSVLTNFFSIMNHSLANKVSYAAVLLALVLLMRIFYFLFFSNILLIGEKRFFMETRTYHDTQIFRIFHVFSVGRVRKAAKIMFLKALFFSLWCLTVVGGIIKYYEYEMIPWIAAENPEITWNQAHTLSKEMMKGNKWHAFLLDLSFLGWTILGNLSLGLTDCFFASSYFVGTRTELYMKLRESAISSKCKYSELLNDRWLTERPPFVPESPCGFKDGVLQMVTEVKDGARTAAGAIKTGAVKAASNVRADFTEALNAESASRLRQDAAALKVSRHMEILDVYPKDLYPEQPGARLKEWQERPINAGRHYGLTSYILLFFVFSFVGWLWEVGLHFAQTGEFANRGTMMGPWLPIYGTGGVVVVLFFRRWMKNPVLTFVIISVVCTTIEYFTSLMLSLMYHQMWWDYHDMFMNFQGRICLAGAIAFGIGGMGFIYFIAPRIDDWLILRIPMKFRIAVCALLLAAFGCDAVYSHSHPNMGNGITNTAFSISPDDYIDRMYNSLGKLRWKGK